ncbi:MAG: aminomethyltransferase beta-barrel domain-containing protein, partial [Stellaceae bacterium]
ETRRVVVGPRASLGQRRVALRDVNWLGGVRKDEALRVSVKLRSAQAPLQGALTLDETGGGAVLLDAPALGVAPWQACVIYDGARVLGGGWIRRAA